MRHPDEFDGFPYGQWFIIGRYADWYNVTNMNLKTKILISIISKHKTINNSLQWKISVGRMNEEEREKEGEREREHEWNL